MVLAALGIFLGSASILWLSTFGYLFVLHLVRIFRRPRTDKAAALPAIAVVVPTLNEEGRILEKIRDLRWTDYPQDKVRWLVVDGGSRDRTAEIVRAESDRDARLRLVQVHNALGKAEQVRAILQGLDEDIVVFTDADSSLHPSCLRELVREIQREPGMALVAATVSPAHPLPEERLHWLFLNHLWWLEGETLSCSGLSGVCYALHRPSLLTLDGVARAEDVHLGALACSRGLKVRLCPRARAVELRTPHSRVEFLRYRRRRGSCYLAELIGVSDGGRRSARWRLARFMRLWQMLGLPWLAAAAVPTGVVLLFSGFWPYPLVVFLSFALTAYLYALAFFGRGPDAPRPAGLVPTMGKYAALLFLSLFQLDRNPSSQGPRGGRSVQESEALSRTDAP